MRTQCLSCLHSHSLTPLLALRNTTTTAMLLAKCEESKRTKKKKTKWPVVGTKFESNQNNKQNCWFINRRGNQSSQSNMSTTTNKRIKTQHESNSAWDDNILRHLVLDRTTEITGTTITEGDYSKSKTLDSSNSARQQQHKLCWRNCFLSFIITIHIYIPDNVTSIGDNAFYHYSSLQPIHIPDSVTTLGNAFVCCCESLQYYNHFTYQIGWQLLNVLLPFTAHHCIQITNWIAWQELEICYFSILFIVTINQFTCQMSWQLLDKVLFLATHHYNQLTYQMAWQLLESLHFVAVNHWK